MSPPSDNSIEIADPFARRLLSKYLQRRQDDLIRLRTALASDDFEIIERTGHNLYGSGGAYGLELVSEYGAQLELAAKQRDATRITTIVDALETFVNQVTVST
ncbi:MAG: Hpt domain-containing protein [Pseudomonadota bacterium]